MGVSRPIPTLASSPNDSLASDLRLAGQPFVGSELWLLARPVLTKRPFVCTKITKSVAKATRYSRQSLIQARGQGVD